jgi:TRAP-type C4-dicarboxylate transport system permease large subunit
MTCTDWLQQYNKAFVGIVMVVIYLINLHYGIELPLDESTMTVILGALISLITYLVPNKKKIE